MFKRLWGLLENGLRAFEYQRMVPNQVDPKSCLLKWELNKGSLESLSGTVAVAGP